MPRINLLPWREQQRNERKLAFGVGIAAATRCGALVVAFAGYLLFNSMIASQQARNERLRAEIKTLDKQIEEINSLETRKQQFIARMQIIEKLQRSRSGDRARVRHLRADRARRHLPDLDHAERPETSRSGRGAVRDPRVLVHAQHRRLAVAEERRSSRSSRARRATRWAASSRCTPTRSTTLTTMTPTGRQAGACRARRPQ